MTLEQQEHKLKIIMLMLLVEYEIAKRKPKQTICQTIAKACEYVFWVKEYRKVRNQPTFESGSLAIVGDKSQCEIILSKNNI